MAELNLKQITDKLNSEFASDVRKLVFWYDANAEFQEDIDSIELENAKVLHLEPDNQFYIKYFLEREDTTTNYLVYAPFAKPSIRDNHLADTIRYSKEFFADRASLLMLDLGIDERYKPVIQHYIKFFANKDRTQKFYDLEIENFNRSTIEVALMSVLCKDKTASFEEVLRSILTDGVCHTTVGKVLGNDDERIVSFPFASDIFKVAGVGRNYVHGGCSPQEILVPMIDVKVDKGKKEARFAEIALVSLTSKITKLIAALDFVKTEPVSDVVKETNYRVYFISDNNEKISNENIVIADKKDTTKCMFRLCFNFKNKKYNKDQKYDLVA